MSTPRAAQLKRLEEKLEGYTKFHDQLQLVVEGELTLEQLAENMASKVRRLEGEVYDLKRETTTGN